MNPLKYSASSMEPTAPLGPFITPVAAEPIPLEVEAQLVLDEDLSTRTQHVALNSIRREDRYIEDIDENGNITYSPEKIIDFKQLAELVSNRIASSTIPIEKKEAILKVFAEKKEQLKKKKLKGWLFIVLRSWMKQRLVKIGERTIKVASESIAAIKRRAQEAEARNNQIKQAEIEKQNKIKAKAVEKTAAISQAKSLIESTKDAKGLTLLEHIKVFRAGCDEIEKELLKIKEEVIDAEYKKNLELCQAAVQEKSKRTDSGTPLCDPSQVAWKEHLQSNELRNRLRLIIVKMTALRDDFQQKIEQKEFRCIFALLAPHQIQFDEVIKLEDIPKRSSTPSTCGLVDLLRDKTKCEFATITDKYNGLINRYIHHWQATGETTWGKLVEHHRSILYSVRELVQKQCS